ncbi:hypothetical protein EJ03DRAFT_309565 [Teratosphaeria nubilosa]|uniref:F-box domain-containing protein n=1 Tax=Teratosphaeria nubilosa TaxID=161662 RepID=A0A6G1LDU2_9PEZI|nr:hypothetical protein EJ03DRAFT_309565 [Teratosphaeria nubilosa]
MAREGPASRLLALPAELVQHILAQLEPVDLAHVAQAARVLAAHAYDDQLWHPLVNRHLPHPIHDPRPLRTYRDLFVAHQPRWFLPQHRLWFSNSSPHGKLLLARYDAQRGSIQAHTVSAVRGPHTLSFWEKNQEVIIHSFNPRVSLDLEKPVVSLDVDSPATDHQPHHEPSDRAYAPPSQYSKEYLMDTTDTPGFYTSFSLCRALPETAITDSTAVWPPMRIPSASRVRTESKDGFRSAGHRPTRLSDVSQTAFRVRRWAEFNGRRAAGPYFASHLLSAAHGGMGVHLNEELATFATLPLEMYTPTPEKPWQGIWCGDYSGHGCEFLVVTQPDKGHESPLPEGMGGLRHWFRGGRRDSTSSNSSYASAQEEFRNPSGRLEAIKLTGDPNIPRGHYTFIAPDIGPGGYLRTADEEIFRGARVVRSAGHIAGRGFVEDQYTPSQLIMVSHDTLAQFWEGYGHISHFQRVDLDALMRHGVVELSQGREVW